MTLLNDLTAIHQDQSDTAHTEYLDILRRAINPATGDAQRLVELSATLGITAIEAKAEVAAALELARLRADLKQFEKSPNDGSDRQRAIVATRTDLQNQIQSLRDRVDELTREWNAIDQKKSSKLFYESEYGRRRREIVAARPRLNGI